MLRVKRPIRTWRRDAADRKRRATQAQRAKTHIVRDGRGRVISSH